MKTPHIWRIRLVLLFWSLAIAGRADQNLAGNVTVTGGSTSGNLAVTGAIDSDSNTFTFGTQGASFGAALLYQDASADTFTFNLNRSPASWLWQHLTGVAAMRLDANHQLIVYQSDGTTAGITLTPSNSSLKLGSLVTLTGDSSGVLTINGPLAVAGNFTNTNGSFTGGASGLTLNAGGTNQSVTLSASGTGDLVFNAGGIERARIKSTGNVGIGTTNPGANTNAAGPIVDTSGAFVSTRGLDQNQPRFIVYDDKFNASYVSYDSDAVTRFKSTSSWLWQNVGTGTGIYTTGTTLMTLRSNGNLGIGTTGPGGYTNAIGPIVDTSGAFVSTRGLDQNLPRFIVYDDKTNASYVSYDSDAVTRFKSTSSWLWQNVGTGAGIYTTGTTLMTLSSSGNLGIGTATPTHKLSVNGTIRAKEVIVDTGWADYVFDESYRLAPLSEVESHIKAEKHLPGIPSAQEVAERGVSMGDMQAKLLSKVEELTLHLIAQEKQIAALRQEVAELKAGRSP